MGPMTLADDDGLCEGAMMDCDADAGPNMGR